MTEQKKKKNNTDLVFRSTDSASILHGKEYTKIFAAIALCLSQETIKNYSEQKALSIAFFFLVFEKPPLT